MNIITILSETDVAGQSNGTTPQFIVALVLR
jgi:hypothetical protein